MKVNKESDLFYKKMLKEYGDLLTKESIFDAILNSETFLNCEIEIGKMYLDELEYNLIYNEV